jgi:hypothetical protein
MPGDFPPATLALVVAARNRVMTDADESDATTRIFQTASPLLLQQKLVCFRHAMC